MFLNFPLHLTLQLYSGIDVTPFKDALGFPDWPGKLHLRWGRMWMGARSSPFGAVHFYYLAEEFVRGNPNDINNPFYWDELKLNLPRSKNYDPTKPRVMKWDSRNQRIACDIAVYIDDLRASGRTVELAWFASRVIASRLQYLGMQDAWAGAVLKTTSSSVICTVTKEKWDKGRRLVASLCAQIELSTANVDWNRSKRLNYKELEIARGFLGHLSMTFDFLVPHLKGFHLLLANHLPKRDDDGWKLSDKGWMIYVIHQVETGRMTQEEMDCHLEQTSPNYSTNPNGQPSPPKDVSPINHFVQDLFTLRQFFKTDEPPEMECRKQNVCLLLYGFADASGGGLGSTVLIPGIGTRYRAWVWGSDDESESSNFKEFENVVLTIEEEAAQGTLKGATMFMFTDNATVEGALFKGNTISVTHIAGKRMIAQGTDGISRGEMNEGVASGESMLSFVPLHLSAFERNPALKDWIKSWLGDDAEFLSPFEWFGRGHSHHGGYYDSNGFWRFHINPGKFVWCPPPAAADVALEELWKALMKRSDSTHVFVCPHLMTPEWRRQLNKCGDLVVFIKAGCECWPLNLYEPLTLGIVFPFISTEPWQLRGTPKLLSLGRTLPKMLFFIRTWLQGIFCSNFADRCGPYAPCRSMWCGKCYTSSTEVTFQIKSKETFGDDEISEEEQERLTEMWGKRHRSSDEYMVGRDGDHLLIPFECDLCVFRKVSKRSPNQGFEQDRLLLACIRRATLDAFWSRASSTVLANRSKIKQGLALSKKAGIEWTLSTQRKDAGR